MLPESPRRPWTVLRPASRAGRASASSTVVEGLRRLDPLAVAIQRDHLGQRDQVESQSAENRRRWAGRSEGDLDGVAADAGLASPLLTPPSGPMPRPVKAARGLNLRQGQRRARRGIDRRAAAGTAQARACPAGSAGKGAHELKPFEGVDPAPPATPSRWICSAGAGPSTSGGAIVLLPEEADGQLVGQARGLGWGPSADDDRISPRPGAGRRRRSWSNEGDRSMICPEAVSTAHLDSRRQVVAAQRERVALGLKELGSRTRPAWNTPKDSRAIPARA